jgi:uroporphyrinogen decarboxylase
MNVMTGRERIGNILKRKPIDRIGVIEHYWVDTLKKWRSDGSMGETEDPADHYGYDIAESWPFDMKADISFKNEIIEETEETVLVRDGNGALLRWHKMHEGTPEHVDFMVKDRTLWEERIKPLLTPSRERINFEAYREARRKAAEKQRYFTWSGLNVFEAMHPVCGHEYMLMGMALDPEWVKDMVETYAELIVNLMEILFAEEGRPDGVWFSEDMGFKGRPFMSPDMYKEIIQPGHKTTMTFCHSMDLPVIMHSCGYVATLLPGMIDAGIDCLQAIEIKSGMDLLKLYKAYGDKISFCGGMDTRNLVANDLDAVKAELEEKIPVIKEGFGYILQSDHSIPPTCNYGTYRSFVEQGLRLGTY